MPGPLAARVGDPTLCPMFDGPKPHVGGPIIGPGSPNVTTEKMPQAIMTDKTTCASAPAVLIKCSGTVLVNKKPAARMGDMTNHGGVVVKGATTVMIGG